MKKRRQIGMQQEGCVEKEYSGKNVRNQCASERGATRKVHAGQVEGVGGER